MAYEDPIVEEIRKIREQLAADFDNDVAAIFADMRRRQAKHGSRLVRQNSHQQPNDAVHGDVKSSTLPVDNSPSTIG